MLNDRSFHNACSSKNVEFADILVSSRSIRLKNIDPQNRHQLLRKTLWAQAPDGALSTLFTLVEQNCFKMDVIREEKEVKAQIIIDDRTFDSIAFCEERALDMAAMKALDWIFADTIQDMIFADTMLEISKENSPPLITP